MLREFLKTKQEHRKWAERHQESAYSQGKYGYAVEDEY